MECRFENDMMRKLSRPVNKVLEGEMVRKGSYCKNTSYIEVECKLLVLSQHNQRKKNKIAITTEIRKGQ